MQYTINHAGVEKRARGEIYDAFRLGLANNDEGVQPDYDLVLQSKRQKGYDYKSGILPKGENETSIQAYFNNQEPLRTGTFKENIQNIKHILLQQHKPSFYYLQVQVALPQERLM